MPVKGNAGYRAQRIDATLGVDFCKAHWNQNQNSPLTSVWSLAFPILMSWIDQWARTKKFVKCFVPRLYDFIIKRVPNYRRPFIPTANPASEARGRSASSHEPDQDEQKDRANRRTNNLAYDVSARKQAKSR